MASRAGAAGRSSQLTVMSWGNSSVIHTREQHGVLHNNGERGVGDIAAQVRRGEGDQMLIIPAGIFEKNFARLRDFNVVAIVKSLIGSRAVLRIDCFGLQEPAQRQAAGHL